MTVSTNLLLQYTTFEWYVKRFLQVFENFFDQFFNFGEKVIEAAIANMVVRNFGAIREDNIPSGIQNRGLGLGFALDFSHTIFVVHFIMSVRNEIHSEVVGRKRFLTLGENPIVAVFTLENFHLENLSLSISTYSIAWITILSSGFLDCLVGLVPLTDCQIDIVCGVKVVGHRIAVIVVAFVIGTTSASGGSVSNLADLANQCFMLTIEVRVEVVQLRITVLGGVLVTFEDALKSSRTLYNGDMNRRVMLFTNRELHLRESFFQFSADCFDIGVINISHFGTPVSLNLYKQYSILSYYVKHFFHNKYFMFMETIRAVFPNSHIVDAALKYPITKDGWEIEFPDWDDCRFHQKDFRLVLILQDILTMAPDDIFPTELLRINDYYKDRVDLDQIIVVVWPRQLSNDWNKTSSFKVVEFSPHQYETWQSYKQAENVLREEFNHKDYEDNFLCMNRIDKHHRRATYEALKNCHGNLSYQQSGVELKYRGFTYREYDQHYDNLMNFLTLKKNFNTSFFSIVTESQYYEKYGIITEKTFNAIVAGHPFIIVGHQGALQDVRDYGFKTFSLMFNEEYDNLEYDNRLIKALEENWNFMGIKMSPKSMYELRDFCSETIDHNRDFFFNEFGDVLIDNLRRQLLELW